LTHDVARARLPYGLKVLWILCLWLLIVGVVLLAGQPSEGYELSIYAAVSPVTWVALLACALGGMWSAIWAASDSRTSQTSAWAAGFGIVVAASAVIVAAPILRGYAGHGRADLMNHAGRLVDIQLYGRIPAYDRDSSTLLYPAPIVILSQIALIAGVEPLTLVQFTALAMFLLGVLFTYLLARTILHHPLALALCTLASSVLLLSSFNYQVMPNVLGFTLFPLVLWLYFRAIARKSVAYRAALIAVTMTYAFIHPITAINLLVGLMATEGYRLVRSRVSTGNRRAGWQAGDAGEAFTGVVLLMFVALATWLIQNWFFWELTVSQLVNLVMLLGRGSYWQSLNHLQTVSLGLIESVLLLIKMHGHHVLYVALTAIGSVTVLVRAVNSNSRRETFRPASRGRPLRGEADPQPAAGTHQLTILVVFLGAQAFILVATLFGGSGSVTYWRALAPIVLLAPVIMGDMGCRIYDRLVQEPRGGGKVNVETRWLQIGATFVLFAAFSLGAFSFFPAPYTYRLNQQISAAELQGMGWFVQHRDEAVALDSITPKNVFGAALQGYAAVDRRLTSTQLKWGETLTTPAHFDYSLERRAIEVFPVYYLPIHEFDRLYHTTIPRNPARLTEGDFEGLGEEPYVNRVYANGEFDLWMIYGQDAVRR